jgi:hypothetical protein
MVTYPGAPGGDRRIRPLNLPKPVEVEVDAEGRPLYVTLPGHEPELVVDLVKSWRVDEEWWRESPISRIYWQCVLANGQFLTIFTNLLDGTWWRQRA